jgi:conjugal transfer mating pair stabilization protein TraG
MGIVLHTYGSGEILHEILNGVAIIFNPQSGVIIPFMSLAAMFGSIYALFMAAITLNLEHFYKHWMIPFLLLYGTLVVPKTSVLVVDEITRSQKSVANVPLGLALASKITNEIGYTLTTAIEATMHGLDDRQYQKTGRVFGAEAMLEMSNYAITDPELAETMNKFITNCVVYDLKLGRYSVRDFMRENNLWNFIESKTTELRGIYKKKDTGNEDQFYTCKAIARDLGVQLQSEASMKLKSQMVKSLPVAYEAITKMRADAMQLVKQQMVMHAVTLAVEEKSAGLGMGHDYAVQKTKLQQRSNMQIVGSMAGSSLIQIRTVFECLLILTFLFIIPLIAIPSGWKIILNWVQMLLWINLWPPFYSVLNFITQITAQKKADALFASLNMSNEGEAGLNLLTSTGLVNLYTDMNAFAGYLALSVPVISYMMIKGGMGSFVHIAGNMMGASASAATSASSEMISGNYNYGNVSMDNTNWNTSNMNKIDNAASFKSGSFTESIGDTTSMHGYDGSHVINRQTTSMPFSASETRTISSSDSTQMQTQSMLASTHSLAATDKIAKILGEMWSDTGAYNKGADHGTTFGSSDDVSFSEALNETKQLAEKYAEANGMDKNAAVKFAAAAFLAAEVNAKVGGSGGGGGNGSILQGIASGASANMSAKGSLDGNYSQGASRSGSDQKILDFLKQDQVQEAFAKLHKAGKAVSAGSKEGYSDQTSRNITDAFQTSSEFGDTISHALTDNSTFSTGKTHTDTRTQTHTDNSQPQQYVDFLASKGIDAKDIPTKKLMNDFDVWRSSRNSESDYAVGPKPTNTNINEEGLHARASKLPKIERPEEYNAHEQNLEMKKSGVENKYKKEEEDYGKYDHDITTNIKKGTGKIETSGEEAKDKFHDNYRKGLHIQGTTGAWDLEKNQELERIKNNSKK